MAETPDLETRVASLTTQLRLTQVIAIIGLATGVVGFAYGMKKWKSTRMQGQLMLKSADGSVSLDGNGLFLRDAKGALRAELSLAAAGTHLVLADPSGRASVQLTAAGDVDAPLSALLIGRGDQPHVEIKAGRSAELAMAGSGDEPSRVSLGYDDTRAALELASTDGKHEARLVAAPGVNEALRLSSGEAQQTATVTLAPGGTAGLEIQDHGSQNGAFLGPLRLKLGGAGKEKVITP